MDLRLFGLMVPLLLTTAGAAYFDLSRYPGYCEARGIGEYCNEDSFNRLIEDADTGALAAPYVNEVAYTDAAVYYGPLHITGVNVNVDVQFPRVPVEATYKVQNTGTEAVDAQLMAMRVPKSLRVFEDGSEMSLSGLYEWSSIFEPGQEKEIMLLFTESTSENVYGYGTNLVIDRKIPALQKTPAGKFNFLLPEGAMPGTCSPTETRVRYIGTRAEVVWEKTDFVPWTNPFNDVICNWVNTPAGIDVTKPPAAPTTAQKPADNTMLILILAVLAAIAAVFLYSRRKPAGGR